MGGSAPQRPGLSPFPLFDLSSGVITTKEPWISPPNAWREILNGYIYRGRLHKRDGCELFDILSYKKTETLAGTSGLGGVTPMIKTMTDSNVLYPKVGADGSTPFRQLKIEDGGTHTGANAVLLDIDGSSLTHVTDGAVGGFVNGSGLLTVAGLSAPFDANVTVTYYREAILEVTENAIMGLPTHTPASGGEKLLAFDLKRYWSYNPISTIFESPATVTADIFTGTLADYFWTENVVNNLIVTNGVDPVCYYTGSVMKELHTDFINPLTTTPDDPESSWTGATGGYARQINNAKMVFFYKQRIVLLGISEGGVDVPTRARWSEVDPLITQSYASDYPWSAENYADCATTDHIVSGALIGDDLVVFFERSTWRLAWTDDFRQPFKWERVAFAEGSEARMSTVARPGEVFTIGATRVNVTDGREVVPADESIKDRILGYNLDTLDTSYAADIEARRTALFLLPERGEDLPSTALALNYEDGTWSDIDFHSSIHVLGKFTSTVELTWNQIQETWNNTQAKWDARAKSAGYPLDIGGDRRCAVWVLFSGDRDQLDYVGFVGDGNSTYAPKQIRFKAKTSALNPFTQQGGAGVASVRLGQIDFIAQAYEGDVVTVRCYADFDSAPYLTKTIDLAPSRLGTDKVRRVILVNRTAMEHSIEIEHTGNGTVVFDAIIPWFEPDGEERVIA